MSSPKMDSIKIQKQKSIKSFLRFNKIVKFLFASIFTSWLISRSSPYLFILLNHHFIFILGNAIILTLFLKFGREKPTVADSAADDLISQIVPPIPPLEVVEAEIEVVKRCRRTRSNEFVEAKPEKMELQRSETEPRVKLERKSALDVDDLSNEEFQRRVEAFIARRKKFLRDESMVIISAA